MALLLNKASKQVSALVFSTCLAGMLSVSAGVQAQQYQFPSYTGDELATNSLGTSPNSIQATSSAANKLVGKWHCTAKKDTGVVDMDINKDITYRSDGTSESTAKAVLSALIGSMTTNLTAKGTWTFDGKTFSSVTKSGSLTSDFMEKEQKETLQEKIKKQETDYAEITFISANKFKAVDRKDKDLVSTCTRK